MKTFIALILLTSAGYAEPLKFYIDGGLGYRLNDAEVYRKNSSVGESKELGHLDIGIRYHWFIFGLRHDSALSHDDRGMEQVHIGFRVEL